jgi:P27 family predicted phage terminase small subunit
LKLLEGGRVRRGKKDEPQPKPADPKPPTWLGKDPEALAEWKRVAPKLHALGIFTELDVAALVLYCSAWGRFVCAAKHLDKYGYVVRTPSGFEQQSPWIGIMNRASKALLDASCEFGMTPSSRARVLAMTPQPKDQFSKFDGPDGGKFGPGPA